MTPNGYHKNYCQQFRKYLTILQALRCEKKLTTPLKPFPDNIKKKPGET
jgi:hypothetical protein